jgi:hypothetical protein
MKKRFTYIYIIKINGFLFLTWRFSNVITCSSSIFSCTYRLRSLQSYTIIDWKCLSNFDWQLRIMGLDWSIMDNWIMLCWRRLLINCFNQWSALTRITPIKLIKCKSRRTKDYISTCIYKFRIHQRNSCSHWSVPLISIFFSIILDCLINRASPWIRSFIIRAIWC